MDSVRHFEFDFCAAQLAGLSPRSYLDLSSPRLLPLKVLLDHSDLRAVLINPDARDLTATSELAAKLGVADRADCRPNLLETAGLGQRRFDLITSISVIEHIPDGGDTRVLQQLFDRLEHGGRLLLTVPVAAEGYEEHVDFDEYGLLVPDEDGFVFGQRFYDERDLQERILSVTGPPLTSAIWGERKAGTFVANRAWKIGDPRYPYWKEAELFVRDYQPSESVAALPGIGVAAFAFGKP